MSKIYASSSQFAPPSTTTTVAPSAGKLYSIIASSSVATLTTITFYDNTAGSGDILHILYMVGDSPFSVNFPALMPLTFGTGLTIVCGANTNCSVIVEY